MHGFPRDELSLWLVPAALGWVVLGGFLLVLTPLPTHTEQTGWSPLFWLLIAPLCLLAGLWLRARPSVGQLRSG